MQSSIELDLAETTPSHHRTKVSVNLVYDNMLTILFSVFVLLYYNRFPAGLWFIQATTKEVCEQDCYVYFRRQFNWREGLCPQVGWLMLYVDLSSNSLIFLILSLAFIDIYIIDCFPEMPRVCFYMLLL